jgi:hypothetical protein
MKVHRELDRVVGKGKTPNMTECLSLTYLHAALKEALRMDPPVPLGELPKRTPSYDRCPCCSICWHIFPWQGVPHVCKEDDIWNGYIIHKDTAIFPNIGWDLILPPCILTSIAKHTITFTMRRYWLLTHRGVMRNPKYWGNYGKLDRFEPERFLPECNPQANELPDVLSLAFGFGKRYVLCWFFLPNLLWIQVNGVTLTCAPSLEYALGDIWQCGMHNFSLLLCFHTTISNSPLEEYLRTSSSLQAPRFGRSLVCKLYAMLINSELHMCSQSSW